MQWNQFVHHEEGDGMLLRNVSTLPAVMFWNSEVPKSLDAIWSCSALQCWKIKGRVVLHAVKAGEVEVLFHSCINSALACGLLSSQRTTGCTPMENGPLYALNNSLNRPWIDSGRFEEQRDVASAGYWTRTCHLPTLYPSHYTDCTTPPHFILQWIWFNIISVCHILLAAGIAQSV